jgi:HEPN superfamily RiboL-PSP-like protein
MAYRASSLRGRIRKAIVQGHAPHGLVGTMPSQSFRDWLSSRAKALDEIEAAHASVGGTGPGRRYATQQINQAYAVLVASQFQGFCRDLHTESVALLMAFINPPALVLPLVQARFTKGRQLDSKNAQPGSLGSDFGLLGIRFWDEVDKHRTKNNDRKREHEDLNNWRNAIAHQNFDAVSPGAAPNLTLKQVRRWRGVCKRLARSFDEVMRRHLQSLIGRTPWPQ